MKRTAFLGGRVWTAGFCGSRRLDVLVAGSRIAEVARAGELETEGVDTIELEGRLLLPGFQDAHIHPGVGGNDLRQCDLLGLESREQIEGAISSYANLHPELEWVLGGGWLQRAYSESPTRELLDGLVGGRKAVLQAHSRHAVWASSAALDAAGIDESTPDPQGGRIERDGSGRPSGVLHENAMSLLGEVLPPLGREQMEQSILAAQTELLKLGITSIQDALVGTGLALPDHHCAYLKLLHDDALSLRVTTALWWDPFRGVEQIAELEDRRRALEAAGSRERIIADTVKMMVDGADLVFIEREALIEATVALDAAGFTVHYHSYGEASTKNVLDAVEAARESNPASRGRHHIAHLMVIEGADFARFEPLGVTANIQGFWGDRPIAHSMLRPSQLSHDPHRREYAFARLLSAGARLAAGSDWPVSSANPLDALRVVTERRTRDTEQSIDELDRLDTAALLAAYTAGSAHVNGRAKDTGRVAAGFLADLVVIDRDLFDPETHPSGALVEQSWIDGERVV